MFDDRRRSLTAGFNEHVTKPIDPRAFLELIEQL
jgi:CheY-like chemotaxis protein